MWKLLNSWKAVLGYLSVELVNTGLLNKYPMLVEAMQKLLLEQNFSNVLEFLSQLLLATGILHKVLKNFKWSK